MWLVEALDEMEGGGGETDSPLPRVMSTALLMASSTSGLSSSRCPRMRTRAP